MQCTCTKRLYRINHQCRVLKEMHACILPMSTIYGVNSPSYTTEIITIETISSTHTHRAALVSSPITLSLLVAGSPQLLQRLLDLDTHLVFLSFFQIPSGYTHTPPPFFVSRCVSHPSCASLSLSLTQPHACGHSSGSTRLSARHLLSCLLRLAPWTPKSSIAFQMGQPTNPTPSSVKPVSAADCSG